MAAIECIVVKIDILPTVCIQHTIYQTSLAANKSSQSTDYVASITRQQLTFGSHLAAKLVAAFEQHINFSSMTITGKFDNQQNGDKVHNFVASLHTTDISISIEELDQLVLASELMSDDIAKFLALLANHGTASSEPLTAKKSVIQNNGEILVPFFEVSVVGPKSTGSAKLSDAIVYVKSNSDHSNSPDWNVLVHSLRLSLYENVSSRSFCSLDTRIRVESSSHGDKKLLIKTDSAVVNIVPESLTCGYDFAIFLRDELKRRRDLQSTHINKLKDSAQMLFSSMQRRRWESLLDNSDTSGMFASAFLELSSCIIITSCGGENENTDIKSEMIVHVDRLQVDVDANLNILADFHGVRVSCSLPATNSRHKLSHVVEISVVKMANRSEEDHGIIEIYVEKYLAYIDGMGIASIRIVCQAWFASMALMDSSSSAASPEKHRQLLKISLSPGFLRLEQSSDSRMVLKKTRISPVKDGPQSSQYERALSAKSQTISDEETEVMDGSTKNKLSFPAATVLVSIDSPDSSAGRIGVKIAVKASQNRLTPLNILSLVGAVMNSTVQTKSPKENDNESRPRADIHVSMTVASTSVDISCVPDSKVEARIVFDTFRMIVNRQADMTSATLVTTQLGIRLRHEYSAEDCLTFDIPKCSVQVSNSLLPSTFSYDSF